MSFILKSHNNETFAAKPSQVIPESTQSNAEPSYYQKSPTDKNLTAATHKILKMYDEPKNEPSVWVDFLKGTISQLESSSSSASSSSSQNHAGPLDTSSSLSAEILSDDKNKDQKRDPATKNPSTTTLSSQPIKQDRQKFAGSKGTFESETLDQDAKSRQKEIKQFCHNLMLINIHKYDRQATAIELTKITPKFLEPGQVVDIIFKHHSKKITPLLEAVINNYPSYSLSSLDKIRKTIIEDKNSLLTNDSLIEMLKEVGLDKDENALASCYDMAYRMNNPNIYQPSPNVVPPDMYNLNFLWINLNPQDRIDNIAQNIFGNGLDSAENAQEILDVVRLRSLEERENVLTGKEKAHWEKIKKTFIYKLSKWADVHPNAKINLWYDSALVTKEAQKKTFEMMNEISKTRGVNIKLKDIRKLPNIKGETENSLHPGVPLYYRVDLLKALITDYMITKHQKDGSKFCVISDIDIEPISSKQLFDQRTLHYLDSSGYVFNRVGFLDFENSFSIFYGENKNIANLHRYTMIDRAAEHVSELRSYPIGTILRSQNILGSQSIFNRYFTSFRAMIDENSEDPPRKVVKCPASQFNVNNGSFPLHDHRSEKFRFIGASNVPYTVNGRNINHGEGQIESLINWEAEPLE